MTYNWFVDSNVYPISFICSRFFIFKAAAKRSGEDIYVLTYNTKKNCWGGGPLGFAINVNLFPGKYTFEKNILLPEAARLCVLMIFYF